MSLVLRKPIFGVSDQVPHNSGCTATEDGWRLEISDLGRREIVLSDTIISIAKTKALISFAVTAKLICVFVFAYVKSRFSHDEAEIYRKKFFICPSDFDSKLYIYNLYGLKKIQILVYFHLADSVAHLTQNATNEPCHDNAYRS